MTSEMFTTVGSVLDIAIWPSIGLRAQGLRPLEP
jgi:hypothetical protein